MPHRLRRGREYPNVPEGVLTSATEAKVIKLEKLKRLEKDVETPCVYSWEPATTS